MGVGKELGTVFKRLRRAEQAEEAATKAALKREAALAKQQAEAHAAHLAREAEAAEAQRTAGVAAVREAAELRNEASAQEMAAAQARSAAAQHTVDAAHAEAGGAQAAAQSRIAAENHATGQARERAQVSVDEKQRLATAAYDAYLAEKSSQLRGINIPLPQTALEHLDYLDPLSQLHLSKVAYKAEFTAMRQALIDEKLLVNRRTWTKDIPVTERGVDEKGVRSIEHLLHDGRPITYAEFNRLVSYRLKQHEQAQAAEMALMGGSGHATAPRQVVPEMPAGGNVPMGLGGTGAGSKGSFWQAAMAVGSFAKNALQPDILTPKLRFIPGNFKPSTVALASTFALASALSIATDDDLSVGKLGRLWDWATDLGFDDPHLIGPDGKPTDKKVAVGAVRVLRIVNGVLQDPERHKKFQEAVDNKRLIEPGLFAIYNEISTQPAQAQGAQTAKVAASAAAASAATAETNAGVDRKLAEKRKEQLPKLEGAVASEAAASEASKGALEAEEKLRKQREEENQKAYDASMKALDDYAKRNAPSLSR